MSDMLKDYVDVATRISEFYKIHPEGRLCREGEPSLMVVGDKTFIVYKALAYRHDEDAMPAPGVAWEPIPGPTNFTRDSELMNAETAAMGRAIVNVGIPSKKVASKEEVEARSGTESLPETNRPVATPEKPYDFGPKQAYDSSGDERPISAKQISWLDDIVSKGGQTPEEWRKTMKYHLGVDRIAQIQRKDFEKARSHAGGPFDATTADPFDEPATVPNDDSVPF